MRKVCLLLFLFAVVITSAIFVSCNYSDLSEGSSSGTQTINDDTAEVCSHEYGDWFITVQATCAESGLRHRTCAICGHVDEEVIDELPHEYAAAEVIQPTCTESGYTIYECINCGERTTDDCVEASGHTYTQTDTPSTCEELGHIHYECSVCGLSYDVQHEEYADHVYGEWVTDKESTCAENGLEIRTCTVCGYNDTKNTDKLTHEYETEVVLPTCTEAGYTLHTCTLCGDAYTDEETEATDHDYEVIEDVSSTCKDCGYTLYECSVCGHSYKEEKTLSDEHDYGEWETVKGATCTENGLKTRICSVCGHIDAENIEKLGHEYAATIVSPTCTEQGYTVYACANCGDGYACDYTDALGHDYALHTAAPTCSERGYDYYECTRCTDSYIDENSYVAAAGHSYEEISVTESQDVDRSGYVHYVCSVCGGEYDEENGVYLCTSELYFEKSADGKYYIVKGFSAELTAAEISLITNVYIPSCYGGLPVKEIAENAFCQNEYIQYVKIGKNVETIGGSAFYGCSALTSVNIPESLASFGKKAFANCTALKDIYYQAVSACDISDLSYEVFAQAGNAYSVAELIVYISATVTRIPQNLFNFETSGNDLMIAAIIFEEGSLCTEIGANAFTKLTSLTCIVIPNFTNIGTSAFGKIGSTVKTIVYFQGTETDWEEKFKNTSLYNNCTVYYYSESEPTDTDNVYWHYADGAITTWTATA